MLRVAMVVFVVLAPVLYVASLRVTWSRFRARLTPPDDLRRADDGYHAPEDSYTGGWV